MKKLKPVAALVLTIMLVLNLTSCLVVVGKESGHRKGWNKNSNNPHHPFSTNPGRKHSK